MVTRRPLPENSQMTPTGASTSQAMPNDSWADEPSESPWEDVAHRRQEATLGAEGINKQEVPTPLRPGAFANIEAEENAWDDAGKQPTATPTLEGAPEFLKPGGNRAETNPFLRKKVPQAQEAPPKESFSRMGLNDNSKNPWQPAIDAQTTSSQPASQPPPPPLPPQSQPQPNLLDDDVNDPWAETASAPQPPPPVPSPIMVNLPSRTDSPAWDDEPLRKTEQPLSPPLTTMSDELVEDQHVWDDLGGLDKGKAKTTEPGQRASFDDWNLIDVEPPGSSKQPEESTEEKPPLPPRRSTEQAPWKPTREPVDGKTETYLVKIIQWHDHNTTNNPRTSPILIQNENGPCPLVALVNALTLTTPADTDTSLVQVLRSREQVSLNLLLDAVFDELMSPRRTNSEDALPDVGDLYAFLQSLHTGMNVNPRFIPTQKMVNAYKRTSLTHLHPTERGDLIPGTFENTAEMSLYATFSIPLIHGWLPPRSDHAYESLERQSASYEDAQNLLFREEELEEKLSDPDQGLTESEQQLYQDIMIIKDFLTTWATQLTPWGIEVIGKAIRPGTFAILFRNDHFSTLYCHPQTMQLLTLVTDEGFRKHGEIVWETLADINGERTEFLSGEFTVVGSGDAVASSSNANYSNDQGGEWTTVQSKRRKSRHDDEPPMSPSTEQEDRDLALALQLQEEEDERHREAEARRRRESILSEQYIEQQARPPGPTNTNRGGRGGGSIGGGGRGSRGGQQSGITTRGGAAPRGGSDIAPGRRSSSVNVPVTSVQGPRPAQQVIRPLIPPRRPPVNRAPDEGVDDAPPTYEQAAQDAAYVPPAGHPSHPASSPTVSRQSTRTSISAGPSGPRQQVQTGRRPVNAAAIGIGSQSKERDCIVM
ncbi:Fc.00g009330.m01.CDS01 [Cosmosporella sp. VM-42]